MSLLKTTLGTIRFLLREDKIRKDGKAPIEITYRVAGSRLRPRSKIYCYVRCWDNTNQRAIYLNREQARTLYPDVPYIEFPYKSQIDNLNSELSSVVSELSDIELLLRAKHPEGVSGSMVVEEWKLRQEKDLGAKKDEPKKYLLDFINQNIKNTEHVTTKGSSTVYRVLAGHIDNYEQGIVIRKNESGKSEKVRIGPKLGKTSLVDADYSFMQSFYNYLIGHVGHLNTTAAKQITGLKTFLNKARKAGYQVNNTFQDFSVKREKLEVIALTQEEFQAILDVDVSKSDKLSRVRDVFVFGCVTGLRYSDLNNLTRENIKDGFLQFTVVKTRQSLTVPLTDVASGILEKYRTSLRPLPVISNQKMNKYIKELCMLAEINEPIEITRFRGAERITKVFPKYELISCHSARKTFVTLSLEKGMKAEEIMPITGHVSYESFKRYLNVTKKQAKTALLNAWGHRTMKVVNED